MKKPNQGKYLNRHYLPLQLITVVLSNMEKRNRVFFCESSSDHYSIARFLAAGFSVD